MLNSFKVGVSESESTALSACAADIDDDDDDDEAHDVSVVSRKRILVDSLSSNMKSKLQKNTFHRVDVDDKASDSGEYDVDNESMNDADKDMSDASCSDLESNDIEFTQLNNNDLPFGNKNDDDDIESGLSQEYDGDDDDDTHESRYTLCLSLKSICCHLLTMIFVSLTQIMVSSALYIIVPLHVKYSLGGGEILTGLIFLNYGFAYLVFHIFGSLCCNYYGSLFTMLVSILLCSVSLLFMSIFTDYFVWLMMMFVQGISFALFTIASRNFIIDNISIKLRMQFEHIIISFHKLSMFFGCIYAGSTIYHESIVIATGVSVAISLSGVVFLCTLSIPPRYNGNCLVQNDSQPDMKGNNEDRVITKASISAWRASFKQISFKQRVSILSWIKNEKRKKKRDNDDIHDATPIYALDDELNTIQVFTNNISTLMSISIFSFGLIFVRCCRLLIVTFKCIEIETLTASDIGYINGISFIPELALYNIGCHILYTFGRRYTLFISYLLFIIALLMVPYCETRQSLSFASLIFGFANGLSHGLIHKVAIDVAPAQYRDKFVNIYQTLTHLPLIIAPIFVAVLVEASGIHTASICCAILVFLSLLWSLCVMTDPNKTGKRYEHIEFEQSYGANNEEPSLQHNGMLINGKHIGAPIKSNFGKFKMELHSIDSVMEHDESVANDTVVNNDNEDNNEKQNESNNDDNDNDDYAERIANKDIGDIKLGAELHKYNNAMNNQYKFEIGHFDEEEEEESMSYQLSSTDDD